MLPPGNSYLETGGIRFLRATELLPDNQIDWDACLRAPEEFGKHDRARIETGDVLLAVKGATIASEKSVCTVGSLSEPTIINGSIFRFRPTEGTTSAFLREVLTCDFAKRQMKGSLILNNAVDYLSRVVIDDLLIPVPSPAQQTAMVARLEAAGERRRRKLAEAEALLAGLDAWLLQQLGLAPPSANRRRVFAVRRREALERLDAHFHKPGFRQITEAVARTPHGRMGALAEPSSETWSPEGESAATFRYIEIGGVSPKTGEAVATETPVALAPSRARLPVQDGDIIVSLTRPHHGSIAMIDSSLDGCIASTGFAVLRNISARVLPTYLWCVLRSRICLQQMLQRSSGGNYPAITEPELKNVLVPLPSRDVQERIVAEAEKRREAARRLRAQAASEWAAAKAWFEEQLLGKPQAD